MVFQRMLLGNHLSLATAVYQLVALSQFLERKKTSLQFAQGGTEFADILVHILALVHIGFQALMLTGSWTDTIITKH